MPGQVIPEASAAISPSEMFAEVRDTHDVAKALRPDIVSLAEAVSEQVKTQARRIDDHEARLRALEKRLWGYAGAVTVLATGASYVIDHLLQ